MDYVSVMMIFLLYERTYVIELETNAYALKTSHLNYVYVILQIEVYIEILSYVHILIKKDYLLLNTTLLKLYITISIRSYFKSLQFKR